jgi:hypothetical protein
MEKCRKTEAMYIWVLLYIIPIKIDVFLILSEENSRRRSILLVIIQMHLKTPNLTLFTTLYKKPS